MRKKRPGVGELIDYTEQGALLRDRHLPETFTEHEVDAFNYTLIGYREYRANINKVSVFHALSNYIQKNHEVGQAIEAYLDIGVRLGKMSLLHLLPKPYGTDIVGILPEELKDEILDDAQEISDRLQCIENAITSPEKVVIRNDRSENLGDSSAVLSGTYAVSRPYGTTYVNDRGQTIKICNTTMLVSGKKDKILAIHPLLRGVTSAQDVKDGSSARWAINQNAVNARFEQWCEELSSINVTETELRDDIRKRRIMRIFNTYVDIASETTSSFLNENESLLAMIEENIDVITLELVAQLKKYALDCESDDWDPVCREIIDKYYFAFELLGLPIKQLKPNQLLTTIQHAEADNVSTSLLYEAA